MLPPTLGVAAESASWFGTALVIFVIALLAWTAMPGGGVTLSGSRAAPILLVLAATALALSRWGLVSRRDSDAVTAPDDPYRVLAASVGGIVARMRADGRVLEVQADEPGDLGLVAKDLMGQGYFDHVHVADRPSFLQTLSDAAHSAETKSIVVRLRRAASFAANDDRSLSSFARAEIRFRALGSRPRGESGAEVIAVARSMSDVYELESHLESARREAEIAKTLKDRLLANVSHELRTPLNAILGFSEILGDAELAPADANKRIEYARIIYSSADHLLSVVNLVLDMSRIEAGKFEIVPEAFSVEPLIKDCCDMLSLKATTGSVTLIPDPLPEAIELIADKRACRQILLNLLSNAVKFTLPNGKVAIGAKRAGDEIHFYVSDTGIGIGSDHLNGLGSPFYQVRSNYNRTFEGAGLGLSLVRGLVGLHGGSMLLETECGVGTRVTARLPVDCRSIRPKASHATRIETIDTLQNPGVAVPAAQATNNGERKFA